MTITHDKVIQTLEAMLDEPDNMNPRLDPDPGHETISGCVYTDERGNHCIAGEVIVRLGGKVPQWGNPANATELVALCDASSGDFGFDFGIELEDKSWSLLQYIQAEADNETTWHNAITHELENQT